MRQASMFCILIRATKILCKEAKFGGRSRDLARPGCYLKSITC